MNNILRKQATAAGVPPDQSPIGQPYQDAAGGWIVFDGTTKHRFPTQRVAELAKRQLERPTALMEMETLLQGNLDSIQGLIDGLAKPARIWRANSILEKLIGGTPDGEVVSGSLYTKEYWLAIIELFDAFQKWLREPLPGCGLEPENIVSQRVIEEAV